MRRGRQCNDPEIPRVPLGETLAQHPDQGSSMLGSIDCESLTGFAGWSAPGYHSITVYSGPIVASVSEQADHRRSQQTGYGLKVVSLTTRGRVEMIRTRGKLLVILAGAGQEQFPRSQPTGEIDGNRI